MYIVRLEYSALRALPCGQQQYAACLRVLHGRLVAFPRLCRMGGAFRTLKARRKG